MSDDELERITERLDELAAMLRNPTLESERAQELSGEVAELATRASQEVDRLRREAGGDDADFEQEELL